MTSQTMPAAMMPTPQAVQAFVASVSPQLQRSGVPLSPEPELLELVDAEPAGADSSFGGPLKIGPKNGPLSAHPPLPASQVPHAQRESTTTGRQRESFFMFTGVLAASPVPDAPRTALESRPQPCKAIGTGAWVETNPPRCPQPRVPRFVAHRLQLPVRMSPHRNSTCRADGPERSPAAPLDAVETLIAQSRRARRRGDERRAVVLLRRACALDEWRPRPWALLGAALATGRHVGEALQALNHARWLQARAGESARAAATARVAARVVAEAA
jgi:hypothetical protein